MIIGLLSLSIAERLTVNVHFQPHNLNYLFTVKYPTLGYLA